MESTIVSPSNPDAPTRQGLRVSRHFTIKGQDPLSSFTFVRRPSRIGTTKGDAVFEAASVEVPDFWDQVATDILASKYFRKTGVPQYDTAGEVITKDGAPVLGPETSLRQAAGRLANAWALWGVRGNYFETPDDAQAYHDEMLYMLCAQMASPNSPVWFNVGIYEAYGIIQDPDGSYYYDEATGHTALSEHRYQRAGASACFPAGTMVNVLGGTTAIEDIRVGDKVVTDKNRLRKVTNVMERTVDETVLRLTVNRLLARPITATSEHPFFSITGPEAYAMRRGKGDPTPLWRPARDLAPGDFVAIARLVVPEKIPDKVDLANYMQNSQYYKVTDTKIVSLNGRPEGPRPSLNRYLQFDDPRIMRLIGRWLGDGSLSSRSSSGPDTVRFTFNSNDTDGIDDIIDLAQEFFGASTTVEFASGQNTANIRYGRAPLAAWFYESFGKGFAGKFIPSWVDALPAAHRIELLKGMWDADGCYLTNGAVAFDFTNYQLSQGVWRLCRSLGYRPVFGGGRVQPLGTAPCWRVSLPAYDAERFEKKEIAASLATATGVIEVNEQTFYRVASIEDIPFYGKVYNLQVKDDETYCVEGVVVHNCYISAVKDQLVGEGSIFDFMQREARLFSQGSGSGANLSDIRAEGEALSAGGSTSGVLSFMKVLDAAAGAIKSGGATRRAAKMVILDADHPEIENYIWAKAKEERKAAILIAGGVEGGYEGDAVQTVAFQNANHSVRITKGFMQALADDAPWPLINRVNGLVNKTISAVQLWREIAEAAWECADPGVQFDEILNDWNTVADTERVRGTNPCFPGSARVHTDRGLLTFKELHALYLANEPFRVYTHNETNQDSPSSALSLSTPEAFAVTGINEIIALTFSNGAELRCTPSHRIFTTNRGFVEAQDLTKDDQVKLIDAPTPAESDDLAADFFHLGVAPEVLHVANNEPLCTLPAEWTKEIATLVGWLTLSYDASTDHESLFSEFLASGLDCPWSLEEFNEVAKHLLRRETPGHIAPEVFQLAPTLLRAYLRGLYVSLSETDVLDTSAVLLVDLPRTLLADIQLLLSSLAISSSLLLKSPILSAKETDLDSLFSDNPPSEPTTVTCLATRRLEPELTYNLSEPLNHSYVVDAVVVANCSEYTHVDDTACNLASINLVKFFENGQFNVDDFEYAARLWTITLEITVSMSHYPAAVIAKKSFEHRTLGLGYANLGALLMRAGLAYDSPEARAAMGAITALMHNRAYATSAELAAAVGPCTAYGDNKTSMARVLHNHRRAAYGSEADALEPYDALTIEPQVLDHQLLARTPFAALSGPVKAAADSALSGIDAAGYRNMQVTVLAPTGCLVGDSQITTSNGLVGLNSLGDENGTTYQALDLDLRVLTDEGSRRVSQFYVNGYANIVEVTTDHGRTLRGTPEHRIRVVDRRGQWYWKRLAEITSGDIVPVAPGLVGAPCTIELPACDGAYTPSTLTAALAELVGRYQARGYENLHTGLFYPLDTLRFAIPDKEVASVHAINALLLEVFKRTGAPENRADGPAIALSDLDLTIWWQTTLDTAPYVDEVPAIILRTNDPLIYGSYVRGLLEADAKFSKAITKTFSCAAAAQQFLALLTTLNVRARITSNPRKIKIPASSSKALTRAIRRRVYYPRIHATRSIVSRQTPRAPLYRSLPLTGKWADVRARAREVAKNEWVPLSPPEILRLRPLSYVDATDLDAARGATEAARHITSPVLVPRHLAEKLYALTLDTQLLHTLRFFYDLISTDAVEAGSDLTYDLVVPDSVTYVANGLVSHNTIGLVMSCDTTGVEPDFALVKMKKLAGGGYMRIINSSVPAALSTLGYSKEEQDRCMTYALGTQTFFADTPVSASTLQVAGATLDEIELAQGYLAGVSDITWAFEPHVVGTALYARAGLDEDATGKDLLRALGFNDAQIESSSLEICGRLTLEGSPDIRPEHLAVFDCAVECGNGTRSIAWSGHVGALSAVAPHISGSVSKTVNLPNTATVADIENAHLTAYQSGVKCIAIYRDGSKVAQPLSSATSSELSEALDVAGAWAPKPLTEGMSPTEYYEGHSIPRFRPPNPRFGPQWSITIGGEKIYIRASSYADGTPAEVFIDWGGQGSVVRGMASALSIAISHALQRGTPLEDIIKAFRNQVFEPRGIVSGHANLKMADSVPDALARILGHFYLNRNDLVQVPGPAPTMGHAGGATVRELTSTVSPSSDEVDKAKLIVAKGEGKRVYGLRCSSCGSSNLIQAGSCHVCGECGETTGCS